jgi:3-deoxy-manno-octulosonate cytidylyltransferase (CMP-KDO synthetase)
VDQAPSGQHAIKVTGKVVGVIPARHGSTRFEGKPLKKILTKPLLQWVIEGAKLAKKIDKILVATDDGRIADLAESCGVEAVMTDSNLPSGSDRVWAAVQGLSCDKVINIQGDEPLITGLVLDTLVDSLKPGVSMATLARNFKNDEELNNPTVAKIVTDHEGFALYFSRLAIPHSRTKGPPYACLKHIGLYGYDRTFLKAFCGQKPAPIEIAEGLEQLRALWMGAKIKVTLTDYESWGVDTPEDVIRVEQILKAKRSGG